MFARRDHVTISIKPGRVNCTGVARLFNSSSKSLNAGVRVRNSQNFYSDPGNLTKVSRYPCYLFTTLILSCLALTPLPAATENVTGLHTFRAEYSLYAKNTRAAQVVRSLTRLDDNSYEYRSETKTVGLISLFKKLHIVESSRLVVEERMLKPVYYSYGRTGYRKKRDVSMEFNPVTGKIKHTINGDSWRLPMEPAVMDKLLYQFAIMYDLQNGRTPESYRIADGGGIKTYSFEKLGEEVVETPLGSFNTIKMLRHKPGSSRKSVFWCAPDLEFLQVKVEHTEKDGSTTVAVLKSLQGELHLSADDAD